MASLRPGSAAPSQTDPPRRSLPAQLAAPVRAFLQTESGSAGLLLAATVVALAWSNSPWSGAYERLWATELAVRLAGAELALDLRHWLADGLMAVFFFVVGLELRRELSVGELTDRRQLLLPGLAAVGGVVVPAALYLLVNPSGPAAAGWGVVIGTDTAFLLGALALVGPAWPAQLRVFLLTLMIADDVVAVSVIGGVYSGTLDGRAMLLAGVCLVALALLGRWDVWRLSAYVLIGLALWLATLASGLHPTLAGMAGGLMVPAHPPRRDDVEHAARLFRAFRQSPLPSVGYSAKLGLQRAVSVNERLQEHLHPWTSYVIVPLFALANVGVDVRGGVLGEALGSAVTWGVVLGLVVGKLLGVGGAALGGVRLGWGALPQGVGEGQVVGGAALCGIGFTVSLLITGLAFDRADLRAQATVGVLLAAVLATALSWVIFRAAAVLRGERTASLPMVLSEPVDPARDHVLGPVDAPLTLVEYGDFQCPFCGRATGVVRDLLAELGPELRYVFRHLPLPDIHPDAVVAARAAEAAAAQGQFWPMHDLLFAHQDELQPEDVLGYAADLGLDVERFARDLGDPRLDERIRHDMLSAEASGARGTPTFFVNGLRHIGPYDADSLKHALRAANVPR